MDWADLAELYQDRIIALKLLQKEIAEVEFKYLTDSISALLPQALENPMLLVSSGKAAIRAKLIGENAESNLRFRRSGDAFTHTFDILERYYKAGDLHPKLNAHKHEFTQQQVAYCFAEWLAKQGWSDINTGLIHPASYDITAIKDGVNLFAFTFGTPQSYAIADDKYDSLKEKYIQMVARSVFRILDEVMESPEIHPVLILPDDNKTRTVMKNYMPISRIGITIFWVKSIDEVKENW